MRRRLAWRHYDCSGAFNAVSVVSPALEAVRPLRYERLPSPIRGPERVSLVDGDSDRLQRAIEKVLTNAVQFTDQGPIDVAMSSDRNNVQIRIRDNGCGVPPDLLPRVFDSFCQGEEAQVLNHGVGLGLTIAQALIKLHHGTIELASAGRDQGTLCTITLPRAHAATRSALPPSAEPS